MQDCRGKLLIPRKGIRCQAFAQATPFNPARREPCSHSPLHLYDLDENGGDFLIIPAKHYRVITAKTLSVRIRKIRAPQNTIASFLFLHFFLKYVFCSSVLFWRLPPTPLFFSENSETIGDRRKPICPCSLIAILPDDLAYLTRAI